MNTQAFLTGVAVVLTVTATGELQARSMAQEASQSSQGLSAQRSGSTTAPQRTASKTAIATALVHQQANRLATTVYVRNIPIVTFLGVEQKANAPGVRVATTETDPARLATLTNPLRGTTADPVWRGNTLATTLNQFQQSGLDATSIKVVWSNPRQSYLIQAAAPNQTPQHLLEVAASNTQLPNSTRDAAQDALQIANRLRFQLGNAAPLKTIEGLPERKPVQTIAMVGTVRSQTQGYASWYGPGFDGNYTASGERFNQYDLTAAHRTLPFGTRVRVTNLDNGRSVIVRINDRGPFHGNRVIDLSKGAAQAIGAISSGIAAVRVEVLQ